MTRWLTRGLLVLLALLVTAGACGGDRGDDGEGNSMLSGAVYIRTSGSLVRVDLARQSATEAYRFETTLLRGNAIAVEDRLIYVDVVRSGDAFLPILHDLQRDTGVEQPPIALDPVQGVASADSDGEFLFQSPGNQIHIWYLPQPGLVAVGIAVTLEETTSYRLDLLDARDLSTIRTLDLGEMPGRLGDISLALDSSGNVAVLLGNSRMNQLLVGSGSLSDLLPAGDVANCAHSASSTPRALRRYFLCPQLEPAASGSIVVLNDVNEIARRQLPGRFDDPLFGVADAGGSMFVGNVSEVTVVEFDLISQQVVAERQVFQPQSSSVPARLKDFFLGGNALAIEVVRRPIAVSPDGERVFFTDRRSVYCLQAVSLELVGDTEFESVRSVASWNDDEFIVAGETTLHVLDTTCKPRVSIEIPFDTRGPPEEVFAP